MALCFHVLNLAKWLRWMYLEVCHFLFFLSLSLFILKLHEMKLKPWLTFNPTWYTSREILTNKVYREHLIGKKDNFFLWSYIVGAVWVVWFSKSWTQSCSVFLDVFNLRSSIVAYKNNALSIMKVPDTIFAQLSGTPNFVAACPHNLE